MTMQITTRPKNVTLIGDPFMLQESEEDLKEDPMNYPERIINLPDLIFTLKHNPRQYARPCVQYTDGKLQVISNKTFFQGVTQAGLPRIEFDLLLQKGLPLEQLMQDFSLEFPEKPVKREYLERFLFFKMQPRTFQYENDLVIPHPGNFSEQFQSGHCLAYKIMIETPRRTMEIDHELVATLVNQNSYLRSINGITSRGCILGRYIR